MKGKKQCDDCEVFFEFTKKDVKEGTLVREDLNLDKTHDDYHYEKSGFFIFRKCIVVSGEHYDIIEEYLKYIECPFCGKRNIIYTHSNKVISSRREEKRKRLY